MITPRPLPYALAALALCLCASWAHAQYATIPCLEGQKIVDGHCVTPPQPLKCGPYQHVSHWPSPCGPVACGTSDSMISTCSAVCSPPPPDQCVDDMHEVTEREWQELMARLKALESPLPSSHITASSIPSGGGQPK